ncbi:type IX secretion system outer membrane channel protein PorV [Formosa sp. S-31]|uniref:type IX secretion system outer membrane channel protein PorV n=1 Tax=Formosa sp. S-31 TaxID=2790949 RepID=UPI003EBD7958
MRKLLFMFLLMSLTTFQGHAQEESGVQTTAAPFLLINPDARSAGMGDIGVATSADANSQFYNAAKNAFMDDEMALGFNYTPWMRDLSKDLFIGSLSFANRINERSTWGVGLRYFSLGSINLYDAAGNSTGSENPYELALDGSYALKLSEHFSMAVTGRYVRSDYAIAEENSGIKTVNTAVVDLGVYYQSDEKSIGSISGIWRAGLSLSNLGSKVTVVEGDDKMQIPTNLKLGTGYEFLLNDANSVTANAELSSLLLSDNDFGKIAYALGAEYSYKNVFALRSGYFHEAEDYGNRQYATLGAGVAFKSARLDMSYLINTSSINSPLANTLRFSLSFVFGGQNKIDQSVENTTALN